MKSIEYDFSTEQISLVEADEPDPDNGEVLIKTIKVGLDGTDFHTINGDGGTPPEGSDSIVMGHEAVGVVEDANGTRFENGDYVVPIVRQQGDSRVAGYFERGEQDMAPIDSVAERGIHRQDGFMQEYFVSPEEFLVEVPEHIVEYGFFVEPLSISEKGLELAEDARSGFEWVPESALVLGNGRLGILTVAMLVTDGRFEDVYCMGRTDRPDQSIDLIERLGAEYVNTSTVPLEDFSMNRDFVDIVFETTGHPPHVLKSVFALEPNGVVVSLGVPSPGDAYAMDLGRFQSELVLNNKAIVGSVNSRKRHYKKAVFRLDGFPGWFIESHLDGVFEVSEFESAFEREDEFLKTVIDFRQ